MLFRHRGSPLPPAALIEVLGILGSSTWECKLKANRKLLNRWRMMDVQIGQVGQLARIVQFRIGQNE
jgi:hypothetical protein